MKKNITWNIVGTLIPYIAFVSTIPLLSRGLSRDMFTLLTFAFGLVGTFGVLDLGFGRNITLEIAHCSSGESFVSESRFKDIWAAVYLSLLPGALVILSFWCIYSYVLGSHPALIQRYSFSVAVLAAASFAVLVTMVHIVFKSLAEGLREYSLVNTNKVITGVLAVSSGLLLLIDSRLIPLKIFILLACGRVIALMHLVIYMRKWAFISVLISSPQKWCFSDDRLMRGMWVAGSFIMTPLTTYLDRYVIAAILGLNALPAYIVPVEILTKMLIIPGAASSVKMIESVGDPTKVHLKPILGIISKKMWNLILATSITAAVLMPFIVKYFMGPLFTSEALIVSEIVNVGVFFLCIAQFDYGLLQAKKMAVKIVRIHFFEALIYVLMLIIGSFYLGVIGAAIAFSVRSLIDFVLLRATVVKEFK